MSRPLIPAVSAQGYIGINFNCLLKENYLFLVNYLLPDGAYALLGSSIFSAKRTELMASFE